MWMVFFGGVAEGDWDRKNGRMLVCVLGNGRMLVCVLRWDFESRRMFKSMRSLYGERTLSIAPGFNPVIPTKRIPLSNHSSHDCAPRLKPGPIDNVRDACGLAAIGIGQV